VVWAACEETKSKVQVVRWVQICLGPLRTRILLGTLSKHMPLAITWADYESKYISARKKQIQGSFFVICVSDFIAINLGNVF
jgi:hypothetical protein